MPNKIIVKLKEFVNKIVRASGIQLTMISLIVVAYGVFLSVQKFLFDFEGFRTKIIIINVLLAVGILIEIIYFIWHTNKYGKKDEKETEINQSKRED